MKTPKFCIKSPINEKKNYVNIYYFSIFTQGFFSFLNKFGEVTKNKGHNSRLNSNIIKGI